MKQNEPTADHKPAERIFESDPKAFDELFRAMYPRLVRFAFKITQDWNASCDITQDIFVMLWKHRSHINPDRSVRAYLYRSVRNRSYNYLRDRKVIAEPKTVNALADELLPDDNPGSTNGQEDDQLNRKLHEWIQLLPDRQRDAFEMSRFEGLFHHEIASVMGVSTKTVNNHLTAALKQLRMYYEAFRNASQERE